MSMTNTIILSIAIRSDHVFQAKDVIKQVDGDIKSQAVYIALVRMYEMGLLQRNKDDSPYTYQITPKGLDYYDESVRLFKKYIRV